MVTSNLRLSYIPTGKDEVVEYPRSIGDRRNSYAQHTVQRHPNLPGCETLRLHFKSMVGCDASVQFRQLVGLLCVATFGRLCRMARRDSAPTIIETEWLDVELSRLVKKAILKSGVNALLCSW